MESITKEFGTAWDNPITADRIFGLIDENDWQQFREALNIDIYFVSDQCELANTDEPCRVVCFPIEDGKSVYYTDSNRIFVSTTDITKLSDSKRHEILTYCLGAGSFDKDEIVNWTDLFLHGEFIKEIN